MVKRNRADIVVEDVGIHDAMEDMAADETEVAIDGGRRTADEVPLFGCVMGQ